MIRHGWGMSRSTLHETRTVRDGGETVMGEAVMIDITVASDDDSTLQRIESGRRNRVLGVGLLVLGVGLSVNSLLGPLVFDVIRYHVSTSLGNQTIGIDAMTLAVVAPICFVLGWLRLVGSTRLSSSGVAVLSLAPALFAAYMIPQYVIGPDYLGLPGNSQRFFLLHLALFIVSAALSILAWTSIEPNELPRTTRRTDRIAAAVLFAGAVFLVFGLHLSGVVDGLQRSPSNSAFLDDPTAFWFVKLLDLGIIVPASIAGGVALMKGLRGAQRLMYALIFWLTLDAIAVFSMAVTMEVNDDPNGSRVLAVGFAILCVALISLSVKLVRPLVRPRERQ
jgi:hypothetical protein